MRLNSLFISSFKHRKYIPDAFKTAIWFIVFLIVLDISINLLFPYPTNPLNTSPGQLNVYFDYGRSVEAKVKRQIGPTDETSAPLSLAGWLKSADISTLPIQPNSKEDLLVASYGMSFSNQVAEAMKAIDPQINLRLIAGPSAPPNYAFTAYNLDRNKHKADVVILGILASSVEALDAISGMNWNPEVPPPYTFPKYYFKDGKLQVIWPEIQSIEELRFALKNRDKWGKFSQQMQAHDRFFNFFIFKQNLFDNSALMRLIRRGYQQKYLANISAQIHTKKGFNKKWEQISVLQTMLKEFAETAKADGRLPIVLLLNNKGYDDHLFQILQQTLVDNSIPYVSTHRIAPATDSRNFVSDGHFIKEVNHKIAQAVLQIVNQHLNR